MKPTYDISVTPHNDGGVIYTVLAKDEAGEWHDCNATGEPCRTKAQLREYIGELRDLRCIDADAATYLHTRI